MGQVDAVKVVKESAHAKASTSVLGMIAARPVKVTAISKAASKSQS